MQKNNKFSKIIDQMKCTSFIPFATSFARYAFYAMLFTLCALHYAPCTMRYAYKELLVSFGHYPKLEYERIVLTQHTINNS